MHCYGHIKLQIVKTLARKFDCVEILYSDTKVGLMLKRKRVCEILFVIVVSHEESEGFYNESTTF